MLLCFYAVACPSGEGGERIVGRGSYLPPSPPIEIFWASYCSYENLPNHVSRLNWCRSIEHCKHCMRANGRTVIQGYPDQLESENIE